MTPAPFDVDARKPGSVRPVHVAAQPRPRRALRRWLAVWNRWLHIYLSMLGLATILFFSATGLTLNHPNWFFEERLVQLSGSLPTKWLHTGGTPPVDWDETDYSHDVDKLKIAESLRASHGLRGAVSDFLAFEDQCEITFQGPGYAAVARVNRPTGEYVVDVAENDLFSRLNDLHKGRNTGRAWSWVIDVSAIVGVLVALTGFLLIFYIRLRRRKGLVAAAVGGAILWGFYAFACQ